MSGGFHIGTKKDFRCVEETRGKRFSKIFICIKCKRKWNGLKGMFLQNGIVWCEDCWNQLNKNQRGYQVKKAKNLENN